MADNDKDRDYQENSPGDGANCDETDAKFLKPIKKMFKKIKGTGKNKSDNEEKNMCEGGTSTSVIDDTDTKSGDRNEKETDMEGIVETKDSMEIDPVVDLKTIKENGSGDPFVYSMNHPKRGKAIIFNNKEFPKLKLGTRNGTDVDAAAMVKRLTSLGFKVDQFDNKSVEEMLSITKEAASSDHSMNDAFAMVILSHGDEQGVYGTDQVVSVDNFINPFKEDQCPTLARKPKLFFIQACRGDQFDSGVVIQADAEVEANEHFFIDANDMLIACSVVPGYFSWRNGEYGSWFIQALSQVLEQYGKEKEIMWMMTRVNAIVAFDYESDTGSKKYNRKKQIPAITSMLTKELYFKPK